MARFKPRMLTGDADADLTQVDPKQDHIILGPDRLSNKINSFKGQSKPPSHRKKKLAPSKKFSATSAKDLSGRDTPVMESCEMRTVVIEADDEAGDENMTSSCRGGSSKVNVNNSCNYKVCTELTTRVGDSSSRRNQNLPPHHLRSNYENNHPRVNSCLRTFITSLVICLLWSCNSITLVHGQPPPLPPAGFLDFDNLPVTRFSCEGKVIGGYYVDVETGCQMFHVCTLGQKDEIQDIKFLCLNGTVFDQETRVCERVDEVDCSKAETFFDLNLDLYVPHATTQKPEEPDLEEEDDVIRPVQTSAGDRDRDRESKPRSPSTTTRPTRATTTTTTPTPSPRTRPPTSSSPPRTRSPPVVSSSSASAQRQTSSQEDEEDDERNGNNAYTSFNYYLKTPHSHVASGYNSQSRQSYLINQPTSNSGRSRGQSQNQNQAGPSGSGSSNNPVAATTSTGRKVPSGPGPKTIVYSSTSTSSSSTQRPKTVVVVKATLPPSKYVLKPKTLATPRTTTSTTPVPPPKYELDDQYDEYYDDEDYLDQQQQQQPQSTQSQSKSSTSYQQQSYPSSKTALTNNYDFRDGRSTKGVANAGQTVHSTTGRSSSSTERGRGTNVFVRATPKPVLVSPANIKVISSKFVGNNSTEEPYYYEDDYPDDATLQQQQQDQLGNVGFSSSTSSSRGKPSSTSPSTSRGQQQQHQRQVIVSSSSKGNSGSLDLSKTKPGVRSEQREVSSTSSQDVSDYYDDDQENVNAHDHHFTHVDVPRIPFAKPNVPRVLVTNGKPFLPRLRRQSHYNHYFSPAYSPPQPRQMFMRDFLLPAGEPSRPLQRSTASLLNNNFHGRSQSQSHHQHHQHHHPHPPQHTQRAVAESRSRIVSPLELRREARAKAIEWGRDSRPFR